MLPPELSPRTKNRLLLLLRIACFFLFVGRAWQHLVWDAPFRALFWDEALMKPVIESLTTWKWSEYVTDYRVDMAIQSFIKAVGVFYLVCAFAAIRVRRSQAWLGSILLIGSSSLSFLAFLYFKDKFFQIGQLIEYAAQVSAPIFLYAFVVRQADIRKLLFGFKVAIALTFTGHGLYAIGYYPIPGSFIDMTINSLGVSEDTATIFLQAAGVMDLILAVLIFTPKWSKYFLVYGVLWGLLTTLARPVANVDPNLLLSSLNQWIPQMLYRFPHFCLPLCALLIAETLRISQNYPELALNESEGQEAGSLEGRPCRIGS